MYIEYDEAWDPTQNTYWTSFGGSIYTGRNYEMFGLLAGVRGTAHPLFPKRGMPDDVGYLVRSENMLRIVDETDPTKIGAGQCSLVNALSWHKNNRCAISTEPDGVTPMWVSCPDWHSHSWLTLEEFSEVLRAYKKLTGYAPSRQYKAVAAAMKALSAGKRKVRVVFWFDN